MGIFRGQNIKTHLLIAAALFVGVIAVVVGSNWSTFVVMYENLAAMNRGQQVAEQMRRPSDLVDYIADHPEHVSLVAYEIGARDAGIFYAPDRPRTLVQTPQLLLFAEYAQRVESGKLAPSERVPVDSIGMYSLPGAGQSSHRRARARWSEAGQISKDSTVALERVVHAMLQDGHSGAADWLITRLGRETVDALPRHWGLSSSDAPLPSSGIYLTWDETQNAAPASDSPDSLRTASHAADTDRVYGRVRAVRRDSSVRQRVRERLGREGLGLSVRDQKRLAQRTYPSGTARDYANLMARIANGTIGPPPVAETVRRHLESPVDTDSAQAPITSLATHVGAMPGIISFVAYARAKDDQPPRVSALFIEDLPIGLFYHIIQTGLDKGFQLRLLSDPEFFRTVRTTLSRDSVTAHQ